MKKLLLLISVIYLGVQASNAYDSFSVKKICNSEVFEHNGQTVDSVIKLTKKITYDLKSFELYDNLTKGFDEKDWEERVDVAYQNGEYMLDLTFFLNAVPFVKKFSSSFNEAFLDQRKAKFEKRREELLKLKAKYANDKYNSIYEKILAIMNKPMELIEDLRPLARNLVTEKMFAKNELKKFLDKYLVKMRFKALPLGKDSVDQYFGQQIAVFDSSKHKLNKSATFYYNVYIPASKSRFPIIGKCIQSKSLPPFYKK